MHCDNVLPAQRDIVGFKIRHQQHKHRAIARLIGAFSKKRKDCGYVLMAERLGFRILFIRPTTTADSITGGACFPECNELLQTGDVFSRLVSEFCRLVMYFPAITTSLKCTHANHHLVQAASPP
jgi:hypothetical protein